MSFLKDLNPVQRSAVEAANGPVLIVAGAGSGKTRVLTYRIAHLISCGVPTYQILALTFTNKAAEEMRKRITTLVGEPAKDIWMGTFHSMFARILRRECPAIGYTPSFTIYDTDDTQNVIKRLLERLNLSAQQYNPSAVRARISRAKNQMLSPADYARSVRDVFDEKVASVYAEYQKTLQSSNAMDFDDLLLKPIELFERKAEILSRYQQRFRFILVDEFQDTNRAQYHVLRQLSDAHKNIAVVGDDAQSIYSFRGAEIRNMLDFERDYPKCQIFRLEQNYRSTKSIITVADSLIRNNAEQLKKKLWTQNPQGSPVTVVRCADEQDEGYQIVHAVQDEIARRKLDLKDFAVLFRTNAQSRAIEDAFRRSSIPYVIVGGIRFYERKEIKDVLAYFRLLANPADNESLLRIINYPSRGIGDTTLEHLQRFATRTGLPLMEAMAKTEQVEELTDRARSALKQFRALILKFRTLREKMSLSEWTRTLVDELGILPGFKDEGTMESVARWENVQELLSAISEFARENPDAPLEAFLENVALVSDIDSWEGSKNAVTLMTLHASKGLEFPVVMIAGLEEGLLPFYSGANNGGDVEEERRLLYVGVTRAEQKLYALHTVMRYRFGEVSYPTESRFLAELGADHVERMTSRSMSRVNELSESMQRARRSAPARPAPSRTSRSRPEPGEFVPDAMPDYESESQEVPELRRGVWVVHESFGRGKVLTVSGSGEAQKATVEFENYGVKSLIVRFARLRPG